MKKNYNVILADPPWEQKTFSKKGLEGRPQHYERMTLEEIKAMPVDEWAAKDCHLFLWTTGPHLEQAFEVIKSWGFRYSGMGFVWIKLNKNAPIMETQGIQLIALDDLFMGGGYTTRKNAEFCLLARKGSPKRIDKKIHEVIVEQRREHSRKPEESYKRIRKYARGPRLELFARQRRIGFDAWGNEIDKFPKV